MGSCAVRLSRLTPHLGLLLVLLIFLIITGYTSWQMPLSVGPDEVAHFMLARFLHREGRLPVTAEDFEAAGYKSDQPPLNAISVAATFWGDDLNEPPFVKLTHGIPRRLLVRDGVVVAETGWQAVNTEEPLAGEYLFWRFGRFLSTIFSGMSLIVIYFIARKTFEDLPRKNLWALAAVMSVAFIPTFIFVSGVLSYENLLGLWLALYLLVAVYVFQGKDRGWLFFWPAY